MADDSGLRERMAGPVREVAKMVTTPIFLIILFIIYCQRRRTPDWVTLLSQTVVSGVILSLFIIVGIVVGRSVHENWQTIAPTDDDTPWYDTNQGQINVGMMVVTTFLLVIITSGFGDEVLNLIEGFFVWIGLIEPSGADFSIKVIVPLYIYIAALLGGLAYFFRRLYLIPKQTAVETGRGIYRIVGVLPIAGGVYLVSPIIGLGDQPQRAVLLGLAFLTGLYVNVIMSGLNAVAQKATERWGDSASDDNANDEEEDEETS